MFLFRCQCVPATAPVFLSTGTGGVTSRQSSTRYVQAPSGAYTLSTAPDQTCSRHTGISHAYRHIQYRTVLQKPWKAYNAPVTRRAHRHATKCPNNPKQAIKHYKKKTHIRSDILNVLLGCTSVIHQVGELSALHSSY